MPPLSKDEYRQRKQEERAARRVKLQKKRDPINTRLHETFLALVATEFQPMLEIRNSYSGVRVFSLSVSLGPRWVNSETLKTLEDLAEAHDLNFGTRVTYGNKGVSRMEFRFVPKNDVERDEDEWLDDDEEM